MNRNFILIALSIPLALVAQQKQSIPLNEAVRMAVNNSNQALLATERVGTSAYELQSVKNNRYPDITASGQYLRLTNADIDLKISQSSDAEPGSERRSPKVNQLMIGQVNVNVPLFSGFRLKNSISAANNLYQAEASQAASTKEDIALRVVQLYADLYKAQRATELLEESLRSSQQRVSDFSAMVDNGLLARNDFLRAQLQASNTEVTLEDARKNVRLINHALITLLKLPENTQIVVREDNVDSGVFAFAPHSENEALSSRKDLEAVHHRRDAASDNVKVARAGYFPSIALVGGYTALDLENVATVKNAMNVGVGLSYNLSSLFKNGTEVKAAKSRAKELEHQEAILADNIRTEIVAAQENYELALKQDKLYAEAVEQALENYRIVSDKYENGLSNTNDLLEADVEQLSARINLSYAKANVILKYYELLHATGQLTESMNLTQSK